MIEKKGPWKIKKKTVVYKDDWLKLTVDDVIRPNGEDGTYSVVAAKHGIGVLPLDDQGYVYLVKEFKYAINKDSVGVPCGGIEGMEPPLETAKRELKEELGITAKKWKYFGMIYPFTSFIFSEAHLFLAQDLEFGKPKADDVEILEPVKIKFEKAVEMVLNNKIDHMPSALLILRVKEYLNK